MGRLKTDFLDLGDIKIAYREFGSGPALILLHGNSAREEMFRKYQARYFNTFHTFTLDSRGHGQTISKDTSYSIEQYSGDVIRFCRAKGITEACVIGHSDGGNIGLFLALKEPDIFKKLVLISPNYKASGTEEKTLQFFKMGI